MSSNSLKFLSSGEHMVSKTPHVLLDNNNGSDFNAEQISIRDLMDLPWVENNVINYIVIIFNEIR